MSSSIKKSSTLPIPLFIGLIICLITSIKAAHFFEEANSSISGLNDFRFADGYNLSDNEKPWRYLTNSTDLTLGIQNISLKVRFDVQEPSMGYNPPDEIHREYISRRTLGLDLNPITIEIGHVSPQFGRGLTLSCKEDREVELYSIVDGVFGQLQYSWVTLQGTAGRPYQWRNNPMSFVVTKYLDWEPDTILVQNEADLHLRDMIAGVYAEAFIPIENNFFSFLSSGSISGGLVRYLLEVGPVSLAYQDTTPFWYQNRQEIYFPSAALNLSFGNYGFSIENALMTVNEHQYSNSMDEQSKAIPNGYATYVSANALLFNVSILGEYKNYYYDKANISTKEFSSFLIPPTVRFQHTWHLLNKHMLANFMGNTIGYNITARWSPLESAMLTTNFSYGGIHADNSRMNIKPGSTYWEVYAEWTQETGDLINVIIGLDYGRLDPDPVYKEIISRTLACKVNAGPFNRKHTYGITLEGQLNTKPFLAEKDNQALRDLIVRIISPDSLLPYTDPSTGETIYKDTMLYDYLVPDANRSHYTQYAFNFLSTVSYTFSSWFTIAVTVEHEVELDAEDNRHVISEITSRIKNYASVSCNLKPFPRHILTLEYGAMSGGKKCTLGTCVDLPPFKGFKFALLSQF